MVVPRGLVALLAVPQLHAPHDALVLEPRERPEDRGEVGAHAPPAERRDEVLDRPVVAVAAGHPVGDRVAPGGGAGHAVRLATCASRLRYSVRPLIFRSCGAAAWSTWMVVCSIAKRPASSVLSSRRRSWQSSSGGTTMCTASAVKPDVTSHTCRSWT